MENRTRSRLLKINHVKALYRDILERHGKASNTKRRRLKNKAEELYTFGDDAQLGVLASRIASIALAVEHWSASKDDRELEFIAQKIKAADEECSRILGEES